MDDRIDRLYELPLGGFVAARNQLATELKRAGQRELAEEVRKLRKPSLVAWLLNQVHRRDPAAIEALREAGHGLLVSQGRGRGDAVAAATAELRAAVARVTEAAEAIGASAGERLSPVQRERLDGSVRALAAWGRRHPPEPVGRLAGEVPPPPLDLLLDADPRTVRAENREPERPAEPARARPKRPADASEDSTGAQDERRDAARKHGAAAETAKAGRAAAGRRGPRDVQRSGMVVEPPEAGRGTHERAQGRGASASRGAAEAGRGASGADEARAAALREEQEARLRWLELRVARLEAEHAHAAEAQSTAAGEADRLRAEAERLQAEAERLWSEAESAVVRAADEAERLDALDQDLAKAREELEQARGPVTRGR